MERGTTRRSRAGWNGRWSGTTSDYDILKVAFYINDFVGLLRGTGTLAKVRVCLPEVRAIQLGNLPSSTASEGHLDRALKDITHGQAANNRIFDFDDEFADLPTRIQAFFSVSTCIIRG